MTPTVRKIALNVLAEYGLPNKIKVRSTTFGCERFGNNYIMVEILDWEPQPLASEIEKKIKTAGNAERIGVMVSFKGSNFVQT